MSFFLFIKVKTGTKKKKKVGFLRIHFDRNGTCDQLAQTHCSNSRGQIPWILNKERREWLFFLSLHLCCFFFFFN